ncbi:MAG: PhoH family protein [Gammaproteobacteria bacterium]|nr:PhoH family protein [Gammaproteobacteria bacterium]MYF52588.1 PhoH family protein [Gammaproteobacteria bacterium]MYK43553.1 PhoH family protein [Gammaproteobacteria bacterium]
MATSTLTLEPNDQHRLAALCGSDDENLRQIERRLQVQVRNRSNTFQITGSERQVDKGDSVIQRLYEETETNKALDPQTVHLFLQEVCSSDNTNTNEPEVAADAVIVTRKKHVKPRSPNQRQFVHNLRHCDVNFGIGPAGTGKTYLAVACAVEALDQSKVNRIILVRPAVEVGEKLGFLPGDLAQKIDPYLRPLYDALYEMLGTQRVQKHIERHEIEVVPLAYMRGRTLNSAFIILDEGQNTTIAQMKMFLTRIGFGSTVAITGDVTQIDLPQNSSQRSGLTHVLRITKDIEDISVVRFQRRDVVRHPVVQHIVDAYERDDIERKKTNGKRQRGSL